MSADADSKVCAAGRAKMAAADQSASTDGSQHKRHRTIYSTRFVVAAEGKSLSDPADSTSV
ncbi:hypothetical protein ACFQZ8_01120 [Micromonospora azadirachtae]|uniref:Uncharacterized protein n=1 Tax=Micromonospora azadirachtae TaxID=1970735 RepID=A0ABW2ZVV1_9ACTN